VVVTDGFTGNVVLKSVEGAAEVIMSMVKEEIAHSSIFAKLGAALMIKALRRLKRRTDYAEYGGAPLLGVKGVVIISHGKSSRRAIRNAVLVAAKSVDADINRKIETQFSTVTPHAVEVH